MKVWDTLAEGLDEGVKARLISAFYHSVYSGGPALMDFLKLGAFYAKSDRMHHRMIECEQTTPEVRAEITAIWTDYKTKSKEAITGEFEKILGDKTAAEELYSLQNLYTEAMDYMFSAAREATGKKLPDETSLDDKAWKLTDLLVENGVKRPLANVGVKRFGEYSKAAAMQAAGMNPDEKQVG